MGELRKPVGRGKGRYGGGGGGDLIDVFVFEKPDGLRFGVFGDGEVFLVQTVDRFAVPVFDGDKFHD